MNSEVINILTMAKVIQTAVAPVFLITGIAATLGVLSNRLARITDRARQLERKLKVSTDEDFNKSLTTELRALRETNQPNQIKKHTYTPKPVRKSVLFI